jgi:hypothetical protein
MLSTNFHWRYFPIEYNTCSMLIVKRKDENKEDINNYISLFPSEKKIIETELELKHTGEKTFILDIDKIYKEGNNYSTSKKIVSILDDQHLLLKEHPNPTHLLAYGTREKIPSILYDNFDYILFINSQDSLEYIRTRNSKNADLNKLENIGIMINNTECENVIQTINI